eukprot:2588304-Prymnesium_polylepis.2
MPFACNIASCGVHGASRPCILLHSPHVHTWAAARASLAHGQNLKRDSARNFKRQPNVHLELETTTEPARAGTAASPRSRDAQRSLTPRAARAGHADGDRRQNKECVGRMRFAIVSKDRLAHPSWRRSPA